MRSALFLALVLASSGISGALAQESYRVPPKEILDLVTAPPAPAVSISPGGGAMFMIHREAMPSIEDVTRPMLRLAGSRIDPQANARFMTSFSSRVVFRQLTGGTEVEVPLPKGAKIAGPLGHRTARISPSPL
ncbi:MAG: hypothetical protein AB8H79_13920 [Myxococcota bacterium]